MYDNLYLISISFLRINTIIPNDSYCYLLHHALILIYKPFIIGPVLFLLYIKKSKVRLNILETLLICMLIYQVGLLIDIFINIFVIDSFDISSVAKMSDNNTGDNIPRGGGRNEDVSRLIRYISANIVALSASRPMNRTIGLTIANAGNLIADILSNEERANYWIDQFNFYQANGRMRGGQPGAGPFERGTNPFDQSGNTDRSDTSNYLPDLDLFKDLFTPVEHSIPLDTLLNVHFILILALFVIIFSVILLLTFLFLNLFILFNKDYLLNRVKNKYAVLYIKYVLFTTRLDIIVIGVLVISTLCFVLYVLHYLIVHPILIDT